MDTREVEFELEHGVEATLVYCVVEYPEGVGVDIDHVYYGYGKNKHDMNFLLDNKIFYSYMQELANEDFEEPNHREYDKYDE